MTKLDWSARVVSELRVVEEQSNPAKIGQMHHRHWLMFLMIPSRWVSLVYGVAMDDIEFVRVSQHLDHCRRQNRQNHHRA